MAADMNDPYWVSDMLSKEFTRQGLRVAEQLRRAADQVERKASSISVDRTTGMPDHNRTAADILGEINSFHGNLSTSNLLTAAADADRHVRNPEAPNGR
ncbi:hypothetical protein [Arthrobacter sp. UYCo732]|uniref:hypothetical protein n=1 Tax=Arthrobacter sp. UYCo732 TaxID=3156336 RepID=UPI0033984E48